MGSKKFSVNWPFRVVDGQSRLDDEIRTSCFSSIGNLLKNNNFPISSPHLYKQKPQHINIQNIAVENKMADREGFEPSVLLPVHTLSRRAHSTTLTPAR